MANVIILLMAIIAVTMTRMSNSTVQCILSSVIDDFHSQSHVPDRGAHTKVHGSVGYHGCCGLKSDLEGCRPHAEYGPDYLVASPNRESQYKLQNSVTLTTIRSPKTVPVILGNPLVGSLKKSHLPSSGAALL